MMGTEIESRSTAYRHDGRYGEHRCFTENRRLDYYRGHRTGRESRMRDARLLEA